MSNAQSSISRYFYTRVSDHIICSICVQPHYGKCSVMANSDWRMAIMCYDQNIQLLLYCDLKEFVDSKSRQVNKWTGQNYVYISILFIFIRFFICIACMLTVDSINFIFMLSSSFGSSEHLKFSICHSCRPSYFRLKNFKWKQLNICGQTFRLSFFIFYSNISKSLCVTYIFMRLKTNNVQTERETELFVELDGHLLCIEAIKSVSLLWDR